MGNLSGSNIGLNFQGILNLGSTINTPLSTTLQAVTDGAGNTSPLQLATNRIAIAAPTLTGSSATSALSISQTWSTSGSPVLIQGVVTNSSSSGSSALLRLGTNVNPVVFNVAMNGNLIMGPVLTFTNIILSSASGNGILTLWNNGAVDFNRLQFGGVTSSFPSIKRNTANLQVRLADDSGFTFIEDLYRRAGTGTPEGAVTAPVGAIYHRTDGGANTSLYVKESGAGNTGWVAK